MSKELLLKKFLDILDHIDTVIQRSGKINIPHDFKLNVDGEILFDAILIRLQAIGETLKKIAKKDPEIMDKHPEIEWKKVIGLRDVISHDYMFVDEDTIFNICTEKIPKLKESVLQIIKELEKEINNK